MQRARVKAGISQESAVGVLACDVRALQRYERGERKPGYEVLRRMKWCYRCAYEDLLPDWNPDMDEEQL